MAAAAAATLIPLGLSLAPQIYQLIAGLVHKHAPAIEQAYPQPNMGPVKFSNLFDTVMGSLTQAAATGQIDKTLPPDDLIKSMLETAVQTLKQPGGPLADATAQPPATSGAFAITGRQVVAHVGDVVQILP